MALCKLAGIPRESKACEKLIAYQTRAASLVHKYVSGQLVNRPKDPHPTQMPAMRMSTARMMRSP